MRIQHAETPPVRHHRSATLAIEYSVPGLVVALLLLVVLVVTVVAVVAGGWWRRLGVGGSVPGRAVLRGVVEALGGLCGGGAERLRLGGRISAERPFGIARAVRPCNRGALGLLGARVWARAGGRM